MQTEPTSLQEILAYFADKNPDPNHLLQEGLSLLVRVTGADRAMLAIKTPFGLEALCWATPEGPAAPMSCPMPATCYCQKAFTTAPAPLIIEDATLEPAWMDHPAQRESGIHAYMGVPIGCQPLGVLSLQSASPRAFQDMEVLFAEGIASLFARILEAEQFRDELRGKDEILALHNAVADDHALEHPSSQLPTRRYLDIWIRANLSRARRSGEKIGVAIFESHLIPEEAKTLGNLPQHMRGEDLLVDLGNHHILLAAPDSNHQILEGLMKRIHALLGTPTPMGATLCDPEKDLEGDHPSLEPAIQRAHEALLGRRGSELITWRMLKKA